MELKQAQIDLAEQRNLLTDKTNEFESAIEKRDVELAREIKAELEALQAVIDGLQAKVEELDVEDTEEEEATDGLEDVVDEEEAEENNTQNEEDEQRSTQIEEDDKKMENRQILDSKGNEEVRAFDTYLETRDIATDGLKTDDNYVVVPTEENNKIIELADDIVRLKDFVTVKKVSTASGSQPVRTTAKAKLSTVAELAESPKVGVTAFTEVDYKIETKRGYIPFSNEYAQDGVDLVNDLKQYVGEVVVNTENDDILTELKSTRAKTVKTVDALKTLINTGFSAGKGNRIKFLVPQSVFDNLDRIKDENGRYLLQESIASETGYKLLGKDVVVLDDEYFPNAKTAFIGDLKEIIYFDRAQTSVQWTSYMHYGECLGVSVRNDVSKIEDEDTKVNIYKVTIEIPTEVVVAP